MPDKPSTLDHIEKTLADGYRKEIDQEENVWRSLPFFAATIALQLAALFQIVERVPPQGTQAWSVAVVCAAVSGGATVIAIGCLAVSILPAKFRYIAPEPELLAYAEDLARDERDARASGEATDVDAVAVLKTALARQYAVATHGNRRINQRRGLWRSLAGMATLISVFATLALVATIAITYVPKNIESECEDMPASKIVSVAQPGERPGDDRLSDQRRVPDMQVVTKGWWTLRQERQPVEALERQDRAERKQA